MRLSCEAILCDWSYPVGLSCGAILWGHPTTTYNRGSEVLCDATTTYNRGSEVPFDATTTYNQRLDPSGGGVGSNMPESLIVRTAPLF